VCNPLPQAASNELKNLSRQVKSIDRDPEQDTLIATTYAVPQTAPGLLA